jgi:MtN3 and saliva related transmembrane protein
MSFESFTGVLASVMGVAMSMAPLLQVRRVQRMGDSSEVSLGLFLVLMVGSVAWILRGVVTADPVLIVPNAVAVGVQVVTISVVLRYRPRLAPPREPASEPVG